MAEMVTCAGIHIVDPPLHVPVPAPAMAKIKEAYLGHYIAHPPMAEKLEHAVASEPAPYKKPLGRLSGTVIQQGAASDIA